MGNSLKVDKKIERITKIADTFFDKKNYSEAIKIYHLLVFNYKKYEYAFELSRAFLLKGDVKSAVYFGEKWLDKISNTVIKKNLFKLLAFCYMRQGNFLKVNEYFGCALKLEKVSAKEIDLKILYAVSFDQIGQLQKAVGLLEEIREKVAKPDKRLEIYLNLVSLYDRLNELKAALTCADYILVNYKEFTERFVVFTKKIDFLLRLRRIEEAQHLIIDAKTFYEKDNFGYQVLDKLLLRSYTVQSEITDTINKYKEGGIV